MSRNIQFSPGEYYHVYNRGAHKEPIFFDHADYYRFLALLYLINGSERVCLADRTHHDTYDRFFSMPRTGLKVDIGAYCLMPNHFHLLVREKDPIGLSSFMHRISTAYTMYFNRRYSHSGALFQGTFKAKYIPDDAYLRQLFGYIHLNPVELYQADWKENGVNNSARTQDFLGKVRRVFKLS